MNYYRIPYILFKLGTMTMIRIQSFLLNCYGLEKTLQYVALIVLIGMTLCAIFVKKFNFAIVSTNTEESISKYTLYGDRKLKPSLWDTAKECYRDSQYFWLYLGFFFGIFITIIFNVIFC